MREWFCYILLFVFFVLSSHSQAKDTIRPKEILHVNQTLVSAGGVFELGFFEDANSGNGFLGIWLKNDVNKKPVWVGNRDNPMWDRSGYLQIVNGNLIILDKRKSDIIVNSGTTATTANTTATLLDSGNFVLQQGNEVIWQSFDYPSDTYLPGMKIGLFGLATEVQRAHILVSWLSHVNPLRGAFTLGVEKVNGQGTRKLSIWRGENAHLDIGSWDGHDFTFIFKNSSYSTNSYHFTFVSNENETYFTFKTIGKYDLSWLVMSSIGHIDEYTMSNGEISSVSHSLCENSTVNYSICSVQETSKCRDGDVFMPMNGSLPTPVTVSGLVNVVFSQCQVICQSNCTCVAFASVQGDQTVCQLYFGDKIGLLNTLVKGEGIVHIRGTASTEQDPGKKRLLYILATSLSPLIITFLISLWCYRRGQTSTRIANEHQQQDTVIDDAEAALGEANTKGAADNIDISGGNDHELPLFNFHIIEAATDNFSIKNKLGEGGFGPVYKGKLPQGQEIAVKRLSKRSGQGVKEFKNEVKLISKLQHRNLVKLLGCCIQGEEYILIYEYMPNRSLDSFIFDSSKRKLLDWRKRVDIIEGIAQGLLYLHKYSRLRIIHRDLKASNILLDAEMNPKISDFGMARIFGENETRAKTNKIAGTYGYMSPEYAMDGLFSEKSDVFSFGIIVLEIISGQKNMAFFESDQSLNLIGHAWNLWKEGKSMEFLDATVETSCFPDDQVLQCLQLGLLCVQDRAADRPTMSDIICILKNDSICLRNPREPAFFCQLITESSDSSPSKNEGCSRNSLTITEVYAR